MAGNQQVIKDWLGRVLGPYPSSDIVSNDALKALRDYPTLQVKTDAFTYDSGQTALLLVLHGTLPITYRSQTYHIPLNVWFPFEYPRRPPMVFVVPTKDMSIRNSDVVDPGGRVGGEMMDGWERKWEAHSLGPLLLDLQIAFSAQPPVYARGAAPSNPDPSSQATSSSSLNDPVTQAPFSTVREPGPGLEYQNPGKSGAMRHHQVARTDEPPPPPARPRVMTGPGSFGPDGVPQNSIPVYNSARPPPLPASPLHFRPPSSTVPPQPISPVNQPFGRGTPPPPPIPPHPPQPPHQAFSQPRLPRSQPPPTLPPYVSGQGAERIVPGYVARPPGTMNGFGPGQGDPRFGQGPSRRVSLPPGMAGPTYTNGMSGPGQPSYRQASPAPAPPIAQPAPRAAPKPPIQDLMSEADEPATNGSADPSRATSAAGPPSRPLPPATLHLHSLLHSHISTRLPQLLQSLHSTTTQLLSVRADLESGEPAVRDEMARLEAVRSVCVGVADRMGRVVEEGERRVGELESKGETSVDEVVCSISIVHNQLIDLVAEDNAIEDTIYHLARALDSERIDLDRFLKAIRLLSREQYQKRALIEKIHNGLQG